VEPQTNSAQRQQRRVHRRARSDGGPPSQHERAKIGENYASIPGLKIVPTIAEYWDRAGAVARTFEMIKASLTGATHATSSRIE
jgi:hypothetical protein